MDYRDTPAGDANSNALVDMLAEYFRKKNEPVQAQQPVGVGPVANGTMYGEMLRQRDPRAIPLDVGQPMQTELQDTPIDELVGRMTPSVGAGGEIVPAGMSRDVAQFSGRSGLEWLTPEERAMVVGKREKPMTLKDTGIGTNEPSSAERPAIVDDIKKAVGPAAGDVATTEQQQKPSEEQVAAVTELAKEKIVSDPNTTPQEKQDKMNQLDSNPGIAQKLAMIAMAVAPTMVGYAMAGKKGAFLGAAATGKGLEAGAKQYQEEDEFKQKLALEREKMGIEKKSKIDTVVEEDQYGRKWLVNKQSGQSIPVTVDGQGQMRAANSPQMNMATGLYVGKKFEDLPGERRMGVVNLQDSINKLTSDAASVVDDKGKQVFTRGLQVPPALSAWVVKHPDWKIGDPAPAGETERTTEIITNTYQDFEKKSRDAMASASIRKQPVGARAASTAQSDKRYEKSIEDSIINGKYKPLEAMKTRQSIYMEDLSKLRNVTDSAQWQTLLKTIQSDDSVVRQSEEESYKSFLSIKTKAEMWLQQYGKLDSKMTDELRNDITEFFKLNQRIRERDLVIAVNEEARKAGTIGKTNVFRERIPGEVISIAKSYERKNIYKEPITPDQAFEMISSGKLRKGEIVIDKATGKKSIIKNTNPIEFDAWRLFK